MLRWKDKLLTTEDKGRLFKNTGAYFLLGLSVVAMTFFGICAPQYDNGGFSISGSAAKVGSDKITQQEFQRSYMNMRERLQQQYQDAFSQVELQVPKYVMRQLVDERVTYQAAVNAGIEAQEDDVIKLLKEAKAFQNDKGGFDKEAFQRYLRSNGYTEASFSAEIRRSISVQNFRQFASKASYVSSRAAALQYRLGESKVDFDFAKIEPAMVKTDVSDADVKAFLNDAGKAKVKAYYDSHPTEFNTKERAKARHILVSYTGARNASATRSKDDAKKQADALLKQAKAPGADFAKLASANTDEASGKTKGGDLGFFSREDMVKEFSDAAFALEPGQVSNVVESPFGFHIIKLEEKQAAKSTKLEDATQSIAMKLVKEEKAPALVQAKADALLADLKAGKSIDGSLKELGSKWESTGLQNAGSGSFGPLGSEPQTTETLLKLTKVGELAPKVLENRGAKFVVRLKNRQVADESKLDDKKRRELAETAAGSTGYNMLSNYEKSLKKELESNGKIWENPEYLTLGQRAQADSGQDGG